MADVRIVSTPAERDDAFAVRIAVFVDEQQIPREEELDDLDAVAVHCVAYEAGEPVGAGVLSMLLINQQRDRRRLGLEA